MFHVDYNTSIQSMGYAFSKLEMDSALLDGSSSNHDVASSSHLNRQLNSLEHDIAQLTKLQSRPHENLSRVLPGKREFPISTVKMLAGREANLSGRGRAYVSQFSVDGSLFVAAFQGSQIRIYDVERGMKVRKNILARSLRWTITETSLSPDKKHLVYASMSPIVHIVNVGSATKESLANITEIHEGLDFSSPEEGGYSFGIFSLKFSTDGREVLLEAATRIYMFMTLKRKKSPFESQHIRLMSTLYALLMKVVIFYSGSDDINVRVSLPYTRCSLFSYRGYRNYEWDYRWMDHPLQARELRHPYDQSIATYKGHSVLRTLIRCYFSPEYSTGQKYIYTGSHDSCIYIYDLISGAQVAKLQHHKSTVRDCSWHPTYPMLVSSSWDGDVVKWEFPGNGESPPPASKKILRRRQFY
ncbi:UNVERIFIED_CONTAM: LEC14B protein [Sesamum calycinum]|uniref:LEC14B protein n=1 Tax=Sesamum calycinum TaxID=2727403 RepID=A0AAW2SAP9_9LAMI